LYRYWREKWSESIQAEWLERFYKIAFSKQNMTEITWWGIVDNFAVYDRGNSLKSSQSQSICSGNWLNFNGQPKESYNTFMNLVKNEWSSNGDIISPLDGKVSQRVFGGEYEITFSFPGLVISNPGPHRISLGVIQEYFFIFHNVSLL
jgi:hypothetical protein